MPELQRHLFVCTNTRKEGHPRGCCSSKGAQDIRERLKMLAASAGLKGKVRINSAGCLDQCEHGVTVVVYPEAAWYGFLTLDDVEEFFQKQVLDGKPVERLRLEPGCLNTLQCPHRGGKQ